MGKYKTIEVGTPDNTRGEKTIHEIYDGKRLVGRATFQPTFYKSKYSIDVKETAYKGFKNLFSSPNVKGYISAGSSAKNPTAVLKQFTIRFNSLKSMVDKKASNKKKVANTIKRTGLDSAKLNEISTLKRANETRKEQIKENQYKIKVAKQNIENAQYYVKSYKKMIISNNQKIALIKKSGKK